MAVSRKAIERTWAGLHPNVRRQWFSHKDNLQIIDGRFFTPNGKDVTHMYEILPKATTKQIEGIQANAELAKHEEEHGGFVFAFFNAAKTMEEQFPDLSQSDLARLMFIGTFTAWETGQLKYDNGRSIDKKGLENLLGMSRNKFSSFYKLLLTQDILAEEGDSIIINQSIFYRGTLGNIRKQLGDVSYTRLFRRTVRDLYEIYNGRMIKQLALIYAVLPFINFNFNVICFNPEESNADLVRPMTLENLAAALGYQDTQKLTVALRRIKYNGQSVFGLFEIDSDKRARKVIVNPAVVYAADGARLDAIKILFR